MRTKIPPNSNPLHALLSTKPFSSSPSSSSQLSTHFTRILNPSSPISSWNSAISDLTRSHHHLEALLAFCSLRRLSLLPDRSTFPPLLKSTSSLPHPTPGLQLHSLAFLLGLTPDLFVASSLLHFYSSFSSLFPLARQVFDETPQPNVVLYTSLVSAYITNSLPSDAFSIFKKLFSELGPGELDSGALVSALSACARISSQRKIVGGVHGVVVKVGLAEEVGLGNTMIDAYAKNGEVGESRKVFEEMGKAGRRDVVSWNTMVAVYAQNGLAAEAMGLYLEMVKGGGGGEVRQNAVTLSAVLLACAHAGALQLGKCIHDQVILSLAFVIIMQQT